MEIKSLEEMMIEMSVEKKENAILRGDIRLNLMTGEIEIEVGHFGFVADMMRDAIGEEIYNKWLEESSEILSGVIDTLYRNLKLTSGIFDEEGKSDAVVVNDDDKIVNFSNIKRRQ